MQSTQILDKAKEFFREGIDQSRHGNHKGAIESFDRAISLNPDDAEVYGHRCVARYRLGNLQGAIADCQRAATLCLEQGSIKDYQYALKVLSKLQR